MIRTPPRAEREPSSFVADLREGWVAFRSRRWVWALVVYFGVANLMWGAWTALGPIVAERDLGGPAVWGTVLGAVGVGALIGSLLATRANPRRPLVQVALCDALFGLPLIFLAAAAPAALLAVAAVLSGAGTMLGMAIWESTLQRHIPAESLSRVSSYDWFGSYAVFPLGLVLWGSLAGAIGTQTALWLASGLFAASVLALLALPDIRRLPASPADAAVA
jgi:MFS family permease